MRFRIAETPLNRRWAGPSIACASWIRARELRLAGALGWFWRLRSHFSEGRTRLAQALAALAEPELGEEAATAAWEEGRRTGFEHAIALALDADTPSAWGAPPDPSYRSTT